YSNVLPALEKKDFLPDSESNSWKLVYQFSKDETEAAQKLKEELDKAIENLHYTNVTSSIDYYDPQTRLVVVHGWKSKGGANGFGEVLKEDKKLKLKRPFFEISTPNYKIIQIHKNLGDYLKEEVN